MDNRLRHRPIADALPLLHYFHMEAQKQHGPQAVLFAQYNHCQAMTFFSWSWATLTRRFKTLKEQGFIQVDNDHDGTHRTLDIRITCEGLAFMGVGDQSHHITTDMKEEIIRTHDAHDLTNHVTPEMTAEIMPSPDGRQDAHDLTNHVTTDMMPSEINPDHVTTDMIERETPAATDSRVYSFKDLDSVREKTLDSALAALPPDAPVMAVLQLVLHSERQAAKALAGDRAAPDGLRTLYGCAGRARALWREAQSKDNPAKWFFPMASGKAHFVARDLAVALDAAADGCPCPGHTRIVPSAESSPPENFAPAKLDEPASWWAGILPPGVRPYVADVERISDTVARVHVKQRWQIGEVERLIGPAWPGLIGAFGGMPPVVQVVFA